jgi:guanosine-3',5'-bis(diphosphate) 3'-pyrophosphohydrolase
MNDIVLLLKATRFAAEKHRYQRRKGPDADPHINHPIEVTELLARVGGVTDPTVLVAGILHDTVEDTKTTPAELEKIFSPDVRSLVEEMTDEKQLPKAERKRLQIEHAPRLSPEAKLIKIADKIANVRDVADRPAKDWTPQRRLEYLDWAIQVVDGCRGVNAALERLFDEEVGRAREILAGERS